jgi:hypothetical protein
MSLKLQDTCIRANGRQPRALTPAWIQAKLPNVISFSQSGAAEECSQLLQRQTTNDIARCLSNVRQELAGALLQLYHEHWLRGMDLQCAGGISLAHTATRKPKLLFTRNTESHLMSYRESRRDQIRIARRSLLEPWLTPQQPSHPLNLPLALL